MYGRPLTYYITYLTHCEGICIYFSFSYKKKEFKPKNQKKEQKNMKIHPSKKVEKNRKRK